MISLDFFTEHIEASPPRPRASQQALISIAYGHPLLMSISISFEVGVNEIPDVAEEYGALESVRFLDVRGCYITPGCEAAFAAFLRTRWGAPADFKILDLPSQGTTPDTMEGKRWISWSAVKELRTASS